MVERFSANRLFAVVFNSALGVLAIGVAIIHAKDFFAFHRGPSLGIPETANPRLYRKIVGKKRCHLRSGSPDHRDQLFGELIQLIRINEFAVPNVV